MTTKVANVLASAEERNESFLFDALDDVQKFRVTGLQTAEKCGSLWRINFLNRESQLYSLTNKGNKYTKIGTLIHLLAENFIHEMTNGVPILGQGDEAAIVAALKSDELDDLQSYLNFQSYKLRLIKYIMGNEVLAVEHNVKIPNDFVNLEGQLDLMFRDRKTGEIVILDHKTNRRPVENHKWTSKFQINAYATAACEMFDVKKVRFIIGNVNLEKDNDFHIVGSRGMMNVRVAQAMENIRNSAEGVHDGCRSCPRRERGCDTHDQYESMLEEGKREQRKNK